MENHNLLPFTERRPFALYATKKLGFKVAFIISFYLFSVTLSFGQQNVLDVTYDECIGSLIIDFGFEEENSYCPGRDRIFDLKVEYKIGQTTYPALYFYNRHSNTLISDATDLKNAWDGTNGVSYKQTPFQHACTGYAGLYGHVAPVGSTWVPPSTQGGLGRMIIPLAQNIQGSLQIIKSGRRLSYAEGPVGSAGNWYTGTVPNVQVNPPALGVISNFNATDDQCNNIDITWDQLAQQCGTRSKLVIEYRVPTAPANNPTRNWRNIDADIDNPTLPSSYPTNYNTTNNPVKMKTSTFVPRGAIYEFRIKKVLTQNLYREFSSTPANTTGKAPDPPSKPTLTQVPDMACANDGVGMQIRWSHSPDPVTYTIERATSSDFNSNFMAFENIPGDSREYTDGTAIASQEYFYRIKALNECDDRSENSSFRRGFIEGTPVGPSNAVVDARPNGIRLDWTNNSTFYTGIILERTFTGGGSPLIIQVNKDSTGYFDSSVSPCVTYEYLIKGVSRCTPEGVGTELASGIIAPDIDNAIPPNGFSASKGTAADKVELTWTNNQEGQTNSVKIYRRVLASGNSFVLLTTLNSGSGIYNDLSANAGELYEYQIIAEGPCENVTVFSIPRTSVGYRRKTGIVTGRVGYADGTAVADVKIAASDPNISILPTLKCNGSSIGIVNHDASLNMNNANIIETWLKPQANTYNTDFTILTKIGAYTLRYDASDSEFIYEIHTNTGIVNLAIPNDSLKVGDWNSLTAMFYQDTLKMFVSGEVMGALPLPTPGATIIDNSNQVHIAQSYQGYLKDIRIWNQGKSDRQIQQDFSRFLTGNEPGLVMYLNAGEGKGQYAYDLAHVNNTYYENHAFLQSGISWDLTENPSNNGTDRIADLLQVATYTNDQGNYNLVVPYSGSGQNFVITPVLNIHKFLPPTKGVFLGDGSPVQNGVDFIDDSSFDFEGEVFFKNMTCGVKDVMILIDGVPAQDEGGIVLSDNNGKFKISVPIGLHVITLKKTGHDFEVGRFPETGKFDFQAPKFGEEFIDSTYRKVIGRVVGGAREEAKPHGLGRSKNNIGMAYMSFDPTGTCGWKASPTEIFPLRDTTLIRTDSLTGEFSVLLPPLSYNILDVATGTLNNKDIEFTPDGILNLTNLPFEKSITDTVFIENTNVVDRVDSVKYHAILEFVHRVTPSIDVTNANGNGPLESDKEYVFNHEKYGIDTIPLTPINPFPFPVFTQNEVYVARISTF